MVKFIVSLAIVLLVGFVVVLLHQVRKDALLKNMDEKTLFVQHKRRRTIQGYSILILLLTTISICAFGGYAFTLLGFAQAVVSATTAFFGIASCVGAGVILFYTDAKIYRQHARHKLFVRQKEYAHQLEKYNVLCGRLQEKKAEYNRLFATGSPGKRSPKAVEIAREKHELEAEMRALEGTIKALGHRVLDE